MIPNGIQTEIAQNRLQITETLLEFVKTDTLLFAFDEKCFCYFSSLVAKANEILGTAFSVTRELDVPVCNLEQGEKLRCYISTLPFQKFLVLHLTSLEVRSVLLGVLLAEKVFSAEEVLKAAFYEEHFEQRVWGTTEEHILRYNTIAERVKELEKIRDDDSIS